MLPEAVVMESFKSFMPISIWEDHIEFITAMVKKLAVGFTGKSMFVLKTES